MSYQIRRINPYWYATPIIPAAAIGGAIVAYVGIVIGQDTASMISRLMIIAGSSVCGIAILAATKPAVSVTLAVLGLLGFSFSFFIIPDVQMAGQSFLQKLVATILADGMWTVLWDAMILAVAFFYNLFGAIWGGIKLDIEESGAEGD